MRLVVGLHQHIEVYVCVPLGGREARVPQELLDGPQVGPGLEHVGGEAVPERVRARRSG